MIHTRDAWDDTFDVLAAEGVPERTIFHCFTGGPTRPAGASTSARSSFSGIVTFKTATDVQAAARLCPADRLLVETDSPYLAPVPHRGRTNQPAYVADVVGRPRRGAWRDDRRASAAATAANARLAFPALRP